MIWLLAGSATLGVAAQALVLVAAAAAHRLPVPSRVGASGASGSGRRPRSPCWTFAAVAVSQLASSSPPGCSTGSTRHGVGHVVQHGVPLLHAPALAGHRLAGHRAVHPDVPVGPRRTCSRGRRRPRTRAADARRVLVPAHVRRRSCSACRSLGSLLRNGPAEAVAIADVHDGDDARPGALRLALPRPARLLRLRGRQDAVPAAGGRHRGRHRSTSRPRLQPDGRGVVVGVGQTVSNLAGALRRLLLLRRSWGRCGPPVAVQVYVRLALASAAAAGGRLVGLQLTEGSTGSGFPVGSWSRPPPPGLRRRCARVRPPAAGSRGRRSCSDPLVRRLRRRPS